MKGVVNMAICQKGPFYLAFSQSKQGVTLTRNDILINKAIHLYSFHTLEILQKTSEEWLQ